MSDNKTNVRKFLEGYIESFKKGLSPEYLERYAAFIESLQKLVALTDYLYQLDDKGDYYPVTRDDFDRMVSLYKDTISQCDNFINTEFPKDVNGKRNVPASVKNIHAVLNNDLNFFSTFTPDGKTAFPDAIEQARGYTIDVTGSDNHATYGDSMSTRIAVRFTDPNGKTVEGFFTSDTRLNLVHDYRKIINSFLDQNKDAVNSIGALLTPEYENLILEPLIKSAADMSDPEIEGRAGEANYYLTKLPQDLRNELSKGKYDPLIKNLDSFVSTSKLLINRIGIADNSPVSSRNNAMTAVANLLGIPEVLAKSSPMKLKIKENGVVKTVTGTFMERAQGVDLARLNDLFGDFKRNVRWAGEFQVTPEALESLAKLQILDFICHNVDRHVNNLSYSLTDGNPPVLHKVQGFDNDLSFGRRNTAEDGNTAWAPTIDELGVIPASLAEALAHVDENMLVTALRGCGLSNSEIALTVERIDLVKNKIAESAEASKNMAPGEVKSGVLRVVEKDGWKDYNNKELAKLSTENTRNIFEVVNLATFLDGARQFESSYYEQAQLENNPIAAYFEQLNAKSVNAANGLPDTILDKACNLILAADDLTSFGSSNFRNVRNAVLGLRQTIRDAWADNNGAPIYNEEFLNRFRTAVDRVRTTANTYLVNKTRRTGYVAENRINAVSLIAEFAEKQYTNLLKATKNQEEITNRNAQKEAYRQQRINDVNADINARQNGNVRPVLQRVQAQIRDIKASMPDGSQRKLLCERALEAQETLYNIADSNGKDLTPEEETRSRECMAALVAYDMAFRARVFNSPDYDEAHFNTQELINSVSINDVFVAETQILNKDLLKEFVDHNFQRRIDQKIIAVSGREQIAPLEQQREPQNNREREVDGFVVIDR